MDAARELEATHLAFIDDDETGDPDWLVALWAATVRFNADVVQGAVRYVFPEDAPKWRHRSGHAARKEKTGDPLAFVGTNNVLFRLNSTGEIRFDEALRLLGGEDITFFDAVEKRGCRIVFCREALTFETVPWERITTKATLRKAYCAGFARVREARLIGRPLAERPWKLAKRFLLGSARVLVSPILFAFGIGLRTFTGGARNVAFCVGTLAALSRAKQFEYYKRPTGY